VTLTTTIHSPSASGRSTEPTFATMTARVKLGSSSAFSPDE